MKAHAAIQILTATTWAFLILNSFRFRLVSRFPVVFALIFYSILFELSLPLIATQLTVDTQLYTTIYMALASISIILTGAVLLSIYGVLAGFSFRRDWHLAAVSGLLVYFVVSDENDAWQFARLINASNLVMTYLGIATMVRSRRSRKVQLGWNLKMVLLAVTVPYVFQAIVFTVYAMGLPLSYEAVNIWLKGTGLAAWIILAVGMMEYSPPTLIAADGSESDGTNGESGRKQTVGDLSETRDQLC